MKRFIQIFSVLIIFLPLGAPISWAQEMIFQKGIAKMQVQLPEGKLTIYLPQRISQGETLSGTIVREPSGTKPSQISKNTKALENYRVFLGEIEGQLSPQYPDMITGKVGKSDHFFPVKVLNTKYETVSQNYLPVLAKTDNTQTGSVECQISPLVLTESIISIKGNFDGNASNTRCAFNNQPLNIIGESVSQCLVKIPGNLAASQGKLEIKDDGIPGQMSCSKPVQLITMEVTTGPLNIQKGTQTYMDVKINGLNTMQKGDTAELRVANNSTGIVTMLPSNQLFLKIPGPGESLFTKRFNLTGIQKGDFNVDVNLDLPGSKSSEPPDVDPPFDLSDLKTKSGYPGSYGLISDEPCSPEGKTIKWRWHKTFQCMIIDRKVLPCGHTKEGNDLYEDIKELLEDLELDKPYETAERMAKAFSTAKAFSYSIHVVRPWVDYDVEYVCRGGVWVAVGGSYVRHGTDDLGWHEVKPKSTFCWLTFSDPADVSEFADALEAALRSACR